MKQKNKREDFFTMLLGTLGGSLLGNTVAGKGVIRAGEGAATVGNWSIRSSFKKKIDFTTSFNKL